MRAKVLEPKPIKSLKCCPPTWPPMHFLIIDLIGNTFFLA